MKIVILNPKIDFTESMQKQLSNSGEVVYMNPPALQEHPMDELVELARNAQILAIDPDVFGGFERCREKKLLNYLSKCQVLRDWH